MAIQQQNDEVARLADRVSRLKIGSQNSASGSRDNRLPDRQRRGIAITPHVAVTTAAALNAERSAHKLKKALLKVRKEPILNVRAASAPRPPSAFETPRKSPAALKIFESVQGPLFPPPEDNESTFWDIDLNVPAEDKFHPGAPLPTSKRGAGSNPKKHSSVSLKRTPSDASPPIKASAADFWGTPPSFPSSKLVGDVKSTIPFVPLTPPTPATPTPTNRSKSPNSLPGGGFEAFLK
jgi:nucleoporin NUP159